MYVHLLYFILTNLSYPGTMSFVQDTYDWIDPVPRQRGEKEPRRVAASVAVYERVPHKAI